MRLLAECIYDWLHGFSIKTGAEDYIVEQGRRENFKFPFGSQRRG
jgi:hypothetical protein